MLKQKFIKIIKKTVWGALPFVALLIFWFLIYHYEKNIRWLIPSPVETASTFFRLVVNGTLLGLVWSSLLNLIPAYVFAAICAVALGVAMGTNRTVHKIFYPFLSAIYPVPSLAWLPFIILFLGFTREAIWSLIFISSFMKIIYNVISGVQNINIEYVLAAKNFGFNRIKIIFNVILPCALPQIITGLRLGFGSAWRSLIGAEMLVATLGGLGKFIWMSQWLFNFDQVIAGIIMISLVSVVVEKVVFAKLEKSVALKWGFSREEYKI